MKKIAITLAILLTIVGCGEKKETKKETPKEGYSITINGKNLMVGDEFSLSKEALGENYEFQEVESCAFEGKDNIYTYADYEIYGYHDKDVEKIYTITLLTDKISTKEGIKLGSTKEEVVDTYGQDYEDAIGAYTYSKGDTLLTFIFEENEVVSIEYKLNVEK